MRLRRDHTHNLLAALAAECLAWLYRCTAAVAEHACLQASRSHREPQSCTTLNMQYVLNAQEFRRSHVSLQSPPYCRSNPEHAEFAPTYPHKTKRPPGNWAASSSRENS